MRRPKRCQTCTTQSATTSSRLRPSREFNSRLAAKKIDMAVPVEARELVADSGSSSHAAPVHSSGLIRKRNKSVKRPAAENLLQQRRLDKPADRLDHYRTEDPVRCLEELGDRAAETRPN